MNYGGGTTGVACPLPAIPGAVMFPSVIFPSPVILSTCAYAGGVTDVLAATDVVNTVVVKATMPAAKMELKTNLFHIDKFITIKYYNDILFNSFIPVLFNPDKYSFEYVDNVDKKYYSNKI
jgi:hypothetical protein